MAKKGSTTDPVLKRLDAILSVLQDLVIIQAKLAGISKAKARAIVGVADAQVTRIWREVRGTAQE